MTSIPSGVVTLLFTDIEGSTRAWQDHPGAMRDALAAHDRELRAAVVRWHGHVFSTGGDGFAVAFTGVADALACAAAAQRVVPLATAAAGLALSVRMGLHSGEAVERGGDYFGPTVNRAARIMAIGHGGQVLMSAATAALAAQLPERTNLAPRGEHRLKDLAEPEPVVELVLGERADGFPPLRSLSRPRSNVPKVRTAFIGRVSEMSALRTLVSERSLVTILAPGGSGKTRLAIELAGQMRELFPDGVWFVDLAGATGSEAVLTAVIEAAQLSVSSTQPTDVHSITRTMAGWRSLIILDNCEQVVDAAATVADALAVECPEVRVLSTSRRPLGLVGEQLWRLEPLGVTEEFDSGQTSDAVRLFIDRVRLTQAGFSPSLRESAMIARICARLDGLPLAIELAAARVATLGLGELAIRIDETAGVPIGTRRSSRHQSLSAVIAWSHDLLDAAEQTVFRRLAVFSGDFTLRAAEAVVSSDGVTERQVEGIVSSLVDQSMLAAQHGAHGVRYRFLETIGSYARALLAESEEADGVRDRHLDWFYSASAELVRDRQRFTWSPQSQDVQNLRSALSWSAARRSADSTAEFLGYTALPLAVHVEGIALTKQIASELRERSGELGARGLEYLQFTSLWGAEMAGNFAVADALASSLRDTSGDESLWFVASVLLAHHRSVSEPRAAESILDDLDVRFGPAPITRLGHAEVALTEQRFQDAVACLLDGLGVRDVPALGRARPDHEFVLLVELSCALQLAGRTDEALVVSEMIVDAARPGGFGFFGNLLESITATWQKDHARAIERFDVALTQLRAWKIGSGIYDCLLAAMLVAELVSGPELAAEIGGALRVHPHHWIGFFALRRQAGRRLREQLGDEAYEAAQRRGAERSVTEALDGLTAFLGLDQRAG